MDSGDDYTVGWICALPIEVAAAKSTLQHIYDTRISEGTSENSNNYILGSLQGHNVVVAYPSSGMYGQTSVADVATQLHESYTSIKFSLLVGIGGGVPDTNEDIRLGDVVVSKSTAGWPGVIQYDVDGNQTKQQFDRDQPFEQPTHSVLTAMGKAETAAIFDESKLSRYISEIIRGDSITFSHPGQNQDIIYEPDQDRATVDVAKSVFIEPSLNKLRPRQPRDVQDPVVHYGLIASSNDSTRHGVTEDMFARDHGILCFETEATGLMNAAQYLVIRGICDYVASHASDTWHAYAAAAAAAYAKEILSFIPVVSKAMPLASDIYAEASPILDALLLTRPEVDRRSLIALKGRRVDGTCEWLTQHPNYQKWLVEATNPVLWVSGGPGKGKTMLAIYITEALQPIADAADAVLLYYFCSGRDKSRNTALTIMRGILHQWISLHPHLAKSIRNSFDGTETAKYTISSFISLWRVFLELIRQSTSSTVFCVLDGLDECDVDSLKQLLDAIGNYLSKPGDGVLLKLIILSRPQPVVLENKLGQYEQIRLDASGTEISHDVERYIFAKVAELASEQDLSDEMVSRVRQTLLAGADGTFLWVGFVANELQGRTWSKIEEVLLHVPKSLAGIYQRLLHQIVDKETLVPILQWVVLAARPLTLEELTVATGIKSVESFSSKQVTRSRLELGGLLVKVEGDVVNLVHESAKEFFQSDQIKTKGTHMFHVSQDTHKILMQTCLDHVERGYGDTETTYDTPGDDPFLSYASQYWPMHFHHAIHAIDTPSEFSRPFFQDDSPIRDAWWKVYWVLEKNGGNPPSFTLLHLAAYFGNVPWARMLIRQHARLISRKDNYGRTPLFWAVNQGHREIVEILLDHGARFNFKDRSMLTALHIAVTGQHKDVVSLLVERGARLETQAEHGDTPLMRAILTNSREITQLLLEHGARVDRLPALLAVPKLRKPTDPMDERVDELLELQGQVFLARFNRSSRFVGLVMKGLGISLHIPLVLELMSFYLKFVALNRWDSLSVLQELVQENKTTELREWAKLYHTFFLGLVLDRNPKRLKAMGDLSTQILGKVAPRDLQALMAITVFTGMDTKLTAVRHGWRVGDATTAAAISDWAAIACDREAVEFFHFGIREFLSDFDGCVREGNREDSMLRTTVLLTAHFAMINKGESKSVEYFSRCVTEFFEGYIGSSHEFDLFSDANHACAKELSSISDSRDSARLCLFLTTICHFAQHAHEKGRDRFFNLVSVACLILCQEKASTYRWLIGEAIPVELGALIERESLGPLQLRACKTLVECLIIGNQYGLKLPSGASRRTVEKHLHSLPRVGSSVNRILNS